jgi:hypothetical protein
MGQVFSKFSSVTLLVIFPAVLYTRGSQTVGVVGPPGGASCLYEGHNYFELNMGYKIKYTFR